MHANLTQTCHDRKTRRDAMKFLLVEDNQDLATAIASRMRLDGHVIDHQDDNRSRRRRFRPPCRAPDSRRRGRQNAQSRVAPS